MLPVLHKRFHSSKLIGGNGALISSNGNVESVQAFSKQQMEQIMSMIERRQATYLIDGHWDYAYTGPLNHPILNKVDPAHLATCMPVSSLGTIVKVLILTADNMDMVEQEITGLDVVMHRHADESVLDKIGRASSRERGYIARCGWR